MWECDEQRCLYTYQQKCSISQVLHVWSKPLASPHPLALVHLHLSPLHCQCGLGLGGGGGGVVRCKITWCACEMSCMNDWYVNDWCGCGQLGNDLIVLFDFNLIVKVGQLEEGSCDPYIVGIPTYTHTFTQAHTSHTGTHLNTIIPHAHTLTRL